MRFSTSALSLFRASVKETACFLPAPSSELSCSIVYWVSTVIVVKTLQLCLELRYFLFVAGDGDLFAPTVLLVSCLISSEFESDSSAWSFMNCIRRIFSFSIVAMSIWGML